MTKMAKKISREIMDYIEITYPFMLDSVLKEEREDILSTAESLIDSENLMEIDRIKELIKEEYAKSNHDNSWDDALDWVINHI